MTRRALIVVDIQNDYFPSGKWPLSGVEAAADNAARIFERIENLRELLSSALQAHLSLVSLDQTEATKKLAAWAAIIAVPTAVAGIYGMNFANMPELAWSAGYPFALLLMVGGCWGLWLHFRRTGWL